MKIIVSVIVCLSLFASLWAQEKNKLALNQSALLVDAHSSYNIEKYVSSEIPSLSLRREFLQDDDLYLGQDYNYFYEKYRKGTNLKIGGMVTTFVGVGLILTGSILSFSVGIYGNGFGSGFLMVAIGGLSIVAGIPIWIVGGSKRSSSKKAMKEGWPDREVNSKKLSFQMTKDGAGLALNF